MLDHEFHPHLLWVRQWYPGAGLYRPTPRCPVCNARRTEFPRVYDCAARWQSVEWSAGSNQTDIRIALIHPQFEHPRPQRRTEAA